MSIYKSDVPELVRVALDSLLQQTLLPNEIVIVGDGPVPAELEQVVSSFKSQVSKIRTTPNPSFAKGGDLVPEDGKESLETRNQEPETIVTYLPQEKNGGLGEAMRIAAEAAKYDYLARMDSDDICLPDRFEKQMKCFEEDPELSLVGGMITEFDGEPENIIAKRILPLEDAEIKQMMRGRCAVNHVTVIFKKADLMRSGNYQPFWKQEDHYLWARMMEHGCKFRNIPDVVVNVRSGKDQIARRGGLRFYKSVVRVFWYMYRHGLISFGYFLYICTVRGIVQVLMPNRLRTWVYLHLLRK
jgi:glycosyltransferase involved in cell wall biosynthesis